MYGQKFGESIADGISLVLQDAEEFYYNKPLSTIWTPPLEGFYADRLNSSLSEDIESALFHAAMYSSSFSASAEASKTNSPKQQGKSAPEQWRLDILTAVKNFRADYENYFDRKIEIRGSGVPLNYSFVSANYAAQFDAVSDINRIQQTLVRAQSKLWQLDRLRDEGSLFQLDSCELLINSPSLIDEADRSSYVEFVEEIRYEASRRELGIFTANSPAEAAQHLIKKVA